MYFTLGVNIPVFDKNNFNSWMNSCLSEYQDNRWNKIISNHYAVKDIIPRIERIENTQKELKDKLDLILDRIDIKK